MTTATATLTVKNQLTIPVATVRKYGFARNRKLTIVHKPEGILITAEPSLKEALAPFHKKIAKKLAGKTPLTNEELSRAARDIWASGEVEFR